MAVLKTGVKKHTKTYTWNVYDLESTIVRTYYWDVYGTNKVFDPDSSTKVDPVTDLGVYNHSNLNSSNNGCYINSQSTSKLLSFGKDVTETCTINILNTVLEIEFHIYTSYPADGEDHWSYVTGYLLLTSPSTFSHAIDGYSATSTETHRVTCTPAVYYLSRGDAEDFDEAESYFKFKYVNSGISLNRQVSSTNRSAYPDADIQATYYYKYLTYKDNNVYSQGTTLQNTLTSYNPNKYPKNGKSGNYWYVRQ